MSKSTVVINVRGCGGLLKRMPKAGSKMTVLGSGTMTEEFEACHSNHRHKPAMESEAAPDCLGEGYLLSHCKVGLSLEGTLSGQSTNSQRKYYSNGETNFVPLTKKDESKNRTGKGKGTLAREDQRQDTPENENRASKEERLIQ